MGIVRPPSRLISIPGAGMTLLDCAWAALELRKVLQAVDLEAFVKTSGKKGMVMFMCL